jgi:hypothetical protein
MLNTAHITARPRSATVKHKFGFGLIREVNRKVAGAWETQHVQVAEPFALDLGRVQTGWENYEKGVGRSLTVVAAGAETPAKPADKARGVIIAPIASSEVGSCAELQIDTAPAAAGFQALFNAAMATPNAADGQIPIVQFTADNLDGEPEFEILDWIDRPPFFGARLVPAPQQ